MSSEEAARQLVVKPISEWIEQLETAVRVIAAKHGAPPATLLQAYQVDPVAYGAMVEAMLALDPYTARHIPQGLISLAVPFMPRSGEPR